MFYVVTLTKFLTANPGDDNFLLELPTKGTTMGGNGYGSVTCEWKVKLVSKLTLQVWKTAAGVTSFSAPIPISQTAVVRTVSAASTNTLSTVATRTTFTTVTSV